MNILLGLLFMIGGIGIVAYSSSLSDAFGRRDRADQHLGGTTQGYIIIGFIIIVISIIVMFGGSKAVSTDVTRGLPASTTSSTK